MNDIGQDRNNDENNGQEISKSSKSFFNKRKQSVQPKANKEVQIYSPSIKNTVAKLKVVKILGSMQDNFVSPTCKNEDACLTGTQFDRENKEIT